MSVAKAIIRSELEGITGWLECIAIIMSERDDGTDGPRCFLLDQLHQKVAALRAELNKLLDEG